MSIGLSPGTSRRHAREKRDMHRPGPHKGVSHLGCQTPRQPRHSNIHNSAFRAMTTGSDPPLSIGGTNS